MDRSKLSPEQKKVLRTLLGTNAREIRVGRSKYNVEGLKSRPVSFIKDSNSPIYKYLLEKSGKVLGDAALSAAELLGVDTQKEEKKPAGQ